MSRSGFVTLRAPCDADRSCNAPVSEPACSAVRPTLRSAVRAVPTSTPRSCAHEALASVCASFRLLDALIDGPVSARVSEVLGDLHVGLLRLAVAMLERERDIPTLRAPGLPARRAANDELFVVGESS